MQTTEENVTTMLPVDSESSWWAWTATAVVEAFGVDPDDGLSTKEAARNRYVWAAVGFCVLLLFGAVYIPGVG